MNVNADRWVWWEGLDKRMDWICVMMMRRIVGNCWFVGFLFCDSDWF